MNEEQDRLEDTARRARELFDASVDALDDATRARLGRARYAAVAATERRARPVRWLRWVPAVAVASTAAVAVLLWRAQDPSLPTADSAAEVDAQLEAVEVLAAGEDLDLVENDLEFYEWLDSTHFADTGTTG
jgi:hypothetical protein